MYVVEGVRKVAVVQYWPVGHDELEPHGVAVIVEWVGDCASRLSVSGYP